MIFLLGLGFGMFAGVIVALVVQINKKKEEYDYVEEPYV